MAVSAIVEGFKPTKGFLIELRKRVTFTEKACEFLRMKRDHLAMTLTEILNLLRGRRRDLERVLESIYEDLAAAYFTLGPPEVESQSTSIEKLLDVDVLPKSVMGVRYPFVKILSKPGVEGKLDVALAKVAFRIRNLFDEIAKIAELETQVERIADELGKTNRKVNALEDIILPSYKRAVKYIEDTLEGEMLEEFTRMKHIGRALARRRA